VARTFPELLDSPELNLVSKYFWQVGTGTGGSWEFHERIPVVFLAHAPFVVVGAQLKSSAVDVTSAVSRTAAAAEIRYADLVSTQTDGQRGGRGVGITEMALPLAA
jgi:hypothetical protein